MVVFVTGCRIVVFRVGIGADLDAAEGDLCTGVDIPVAVCADQGPDIFRQFLILCRGG